MEREEFIILLKVLGLNSYEAKAYLASLLDRAIRPSEIYKSAEIPQTRVYDILASLENKGYVKKSNSFYVPVNLSDIISTPQIEETSLKLKQQMNKASKKLEELTVNMAVIDSVRMYINRLSEIHRKNYQNAEQGEKDEDEIVILKGNEAVSKTLMGLFSKARNNVASVSKNPPFILYPADPIFEQIMKALARGVQYSRVISLDYLLGQGLENAKTDLQTGIKIRVLPDSNIPSKFYIVDEEIALLRADEQQHKKAVVLKDREIASILRQSFTLLWEKASELKEVLDRIETLEPSSSLTEDEQQIYEYLLRRGRSTISEMSIALSISVAKCNELVIRLCEEGIVEVVPVINKYKLSLTDSMENNSFKK